MSHRTLLALISSAFRLLLIPRLFLATTLLLALITTHSSLVRAQENSARISGIVTDQQKAVVRGAKVDLINLDTGVHYPTVSNGDGVYVIFAPIGNYRLQVDHVGFRTVIAANIVLHTEDAREINFELAVGSTSETVTVNAGATNDNPAVSMTVTREFIENMPLNGQSFQDLIQLAPGTVSSGFGGTSSGYYSINGQRTDSNNFTVDGVSANLGGVINQANPGSPGSGLSGSSPAQTALDTTQSLASVDSLQEFTIQTSGYSAEYGRNPGGQVGFTTRSGTNEPHGTAFDYFRNTALDANSAGNDYYGIPKSAEHQNDFGGTFGGPVIIPKLYSGKDKTFYFLSYEGLRLLLPNSMSEYTPTQAFRNWASPNVEPFLNAAPLPNGPLNQDGCTVTDPATGQQNACDGMFNYAYSYPNSLDSYSGRLDNSFSKRFIAFVRYADTPSLISFGAGQTYSYIVNAHAWTAGLTSTISSSLVDDFRFNYSHDGEQSVENLDSVNGSVPFAKNLVIPPAYAGPYDLSMVNISVPGTGVGGGGTYGGTGSVQHQYEILDNATWTRGTHSLKFGSDWRHLTPEWVSTPYTSSVYITGLSDIMNGNATLLNVDAIAPGKPVFDNLSLYVQDHWKIRRSLSVDSGLRWDFNPPPGPSNGHYPATITSSDLSIATLAPLGTDPYKTNYHSFGPRFGFAWNAIPSKTHALTVRGSFGIFFDTAQQTIGSAYAGSYPFAAPTNTLKEVPLPLSEMALAPPSLNFPLTPPYYLGSTVSPDLTAPYTEQWNLSVDLTLSQNNILTTSYVGNDGKKLLYSQGYNNGVEGNPNFSNIFFTSNEARSNYNGLQVQDRGQITTGLNVVASFTWAHALDNSSNDSTLSAPIYGNSDNDLRRAFNLALNYQTRVSGADGWAKALAHGWTLSNRFAAQSGYSMNVVQAYGNLPNGGSLLYQPDLVPGATIYLHGSTADINGLPVPGSWRLNQAAFALVPTDPTTGYPIRQGTLGRNFIYGPGFWTLNTAVQRNFPIHEQLHLLFRVDAFNIFNHPNYSSLGNYFPSSNFGYSNGYAGTIGSSNALYAMGSARSLQLSLKLQF